MTIDLAAPWRSMALHGFPKRGAPLCLSGEGVQTQDRCMEVLLTHEGAWEHPSESIGIFLGEMRLTSITGWWLSIWLMYGYSMVNDG